MDIPKLNYDDFYKFVMSAGVITLIFGIMAYSLLAQVKFDIGLNILTIGVVLYFLLACFGLIMIIWSGKQWYKNQKLYDRKLEAETKIQEHTVSTIIKQDISSNGPSESVKQRNEKRTAAIVDCKIASSLPNSVNFNFIRDWKVWFLIANYDNAKYRAYVRIKFITENYSEDIPQGHYGGTIAWNLNESLAIQAPGLGIPEKIKDAAKEKHKILIQINCEVKDENDIFIEKKLPMTYAYDYQNNSWYLEP